MDSVHGGFLKAFKADRLDDFLGPDGTLRAGFSETIRSSRWKLDRWEVFGIVDSRDFLCHWALVRRVKKVPTALLQIMFVELENVEVQLGDVLEQSGHPLRERLSQLRHDPDETLALGSWLWADLKKCVARLSPAAAEALSRLEGTRDERLASETALNDDVTPLLVDCAGVALQVFDGTCSLRKEVVSSSSVDHRGLDSAFPQDLGWVRMREDQMLRNDFGVFPDGELEGRTKLRRIFRVAGRQLEVLVVDGDRIETKLGADLLYYNRTFDAWTLVQYKVLDHGYPDGRHQWLYRLNEQGIHQLERMSAFRASHTDQWRIEDPPDCYRLCGDGFFFKFCQRGQWEASEGDLIRGMYVPREHLESLRACRELDGLRGGCVITQETLGRHLNNTTFTDLVRDGWLGTRGVSSAAISEIIRQLVTSGDPFVSAVEIESEELHANARATNRGFRSPS